MLISWQLFLAFFKVGIFGYGGGPAAIPLAQQEVVDNYHWMSKEEFADMLAMANALPGPIATKMAAYVGYKMAGWWGALAALVGVVVPTAMAVVALGAFFWRYRHHPGIAGMLKAVRPVVVVLLLQTAWEMGQNAFPDQFTWLVAGASLLALLWLKIHPAWVISLSMALGFLFQAGVFKEGR